MNVPLKKFSHQKLLCSFLFGLVYFVIRYANSFCLQATYEKWVIFLQILHCPDMLFHHVNNKIWSKKAFKMHISQSFFPALLSCAIWSCAMLDCFFDSFSYYILHKRLLLHLTIYCGELVRRIGYSCSCYGRI